MGTEWAQKRVTLQSRKRGCHVVTREIYDQVPELQEFEMGLANLWSAPPTCAQPRQRFTVVHMSAAVYPRHAAAHRARQRTFARNASARLWHGRHVHDTGMLLSRRARPAVLHTSASLTINENASPDVPLDLADALDRLAPEGTKHKYRHDDEGCAAHPVVVLLYLLALTSVPVQPCKCCSRYWRLR